MRAGGAPSLKAADARAPHACGAGTERRRGRHCLAACLLLALSACVLEDVELTGVEDVLVAEALVQIRDDGTGAFRPRLWALLHRSAGGDHGTMAYAKVTVRGPHGTVQLLPRPTTECVATAPDYAVGCFRASAADEERVSPGDSLTLEIETELGILRGFTVVPSEFQLVGRPETGICVMQPESTMDLRWTRSEGAWGYFADAIVRDLQQIVPEGWAVDPTIRISGAALADGDTAIVFPTELGLRERFSQDPALLIQLQNGFPSGAFAEISITAAERNYFNWHRGSVFNPSGQVRLPSLRGAGTGYFGAVVVRTLSVWAPPRAGWDPDREAPCP